MKRKQITFKVLYSDNYLYKPVVGSTVYLKESQTLWTSNVPLANIKAGDVSKPVFTLSKTCPVSNENIEIEEGWLGAYCRDGRQDDSWSLGKWLVTKVIYDLPLTKSEQYECNSKFHVYLKKVE